MLRHALCLVMLCGLVGCSKESPAPEKTKPAAAKPAAAKPAKKPTAASAEPKNADAPSCRAQTIVRQGWNGSEKACSGAKQALETMSGSLFACDEDADCMVHSIAGGCLGMGGKRDHQFARLPALCQGAECKDADFSDHRIRCEAGCCVIFEE